MDAAKTPETTPGVRRLIEQLEALGADPSAAAIQGVLKRLELTSEDLANFVRTDHRRYHRCRIAQRPAFEVLAMTWLPGQCSPPHDHGGSICGMRVMRGTAIERTYRVADDVLADACMDERLPEGRP